MSDENETKAPEQPQEVGPKPGKRYSTKRKRISVCIDDNEDWALVQLKGEERDEYIKSLRERYKDKNGAFTKELHNPVGLQADLIHLCLRDPNDKKVPKEAIQAWPSEMVTELYDDCVEMNGVGDKARAVAKNDSAAKDGTGTQSPTT